MPDSQMGAESLIRLTKPLTRNRRFLGLVIVAAMITGILALVYHLEIKKNEGNFERYGNAVLESQYEQIASILENQILSVNAKGADSNRTQIANAELVESGNLERLINQNASKLLDYSEFEHYLLLIEFQSSSLEVRDSLLISSFKDLSPGQQDSLFGKGPLNTGLIGKVKVKNSESFNIISSRFYHEGVNVSDFSANIRIAGLTSTKQYKKVTRSLGPAMIASLTLFLIVALLGVPFMKMVFITKYERLDRTDIIWTGLSLLVGLPVLLIVLFGSLTYLYNTTYQIPDKLSSLNERITASFQQQLLEVEQLSEYSFSNTQFFHPPDKDQKNLAPYFKLVSCLRNDGEVCHSTHFIKRPAGLTKLNLSQRSYFRDMLDNRNVWDAHGVDYVMRPVVSIEDQSEEGVFIIPDKNSDCDYLVASAFMSSVQSHRLPRGYQHAIIDDSGLVWFHTSEGRSTVENFFDVCTQTTTLLGAIKTGISAQGKVKYHNKTKLYNLIPIEDKGLYSVVLYERRQATESVFSIVCLMLVHVLPLLILNLLIAFLMSLFARNTISSDSRGQQILEYFIPGTETSSALKRTSLISIGVAIVGLLAILFGPKSWSLIIAYLAPLASIPIIWILSNNLHPNTSPTTHSTSIYHTRVMFLWLFAIVGIPTMLVFNNSVDRISEFNTRVDLYTQVKSALDLEYSMYDDIPLDTSIEHETNRVYYTHVRQGSYFEKPVRPSTPTPAFEESPKNSLQAQFRVLTTPLFNQQLGLFRGLLFDNSYPEWYFKRNKNGLSYLKRVDGSDRYVCARSTVPRLFAPWAWRVLVVLSVLATLFAIYKLYIFTSKRFFAPEAQGIWTLGSKERQHHATTIYNKITSSNGPRNFLIVGPPGSSKFEFVQLVVSGKAEGNQKPLLFNELSFINSHLSTGIDLDKFIQQLSPNAAVDSALPVYVIRHLEHNIKSIEWNRKKLQTITYLMGRNKSLVVTSEVFPNQILGFYEDQENEKDELSVGLASDYSAWRDVLGSFELIVLGTTSTTKQEPVLRDQFKTSMEGQAKYHAYFMDIWNSLGSEEQYMLYDLAEDGFVNTKNKFALYSLLRKGIITHQGRLKFTDRLFQMFILNSVSSKEALKLERSERSAGSWSTIKIVLYMLLATVAVFLVIGNPDIMRDVEMFYGAFAGIGAFMTLILNLLSRGQVKA